MDVVGILLSVAVDAVAVIVAAASVILIVDASGIVVDIPHSDDNAVPLVVVLSVPQPDVVAGCDVADDDVDADDDECNVASAPVSCVDIDFVGLALI